MKYKKFIIVLLNLINTKNLINLKNLIIKIPIIYVVINIKKINVIKMKIYIIITEKHSTQRHNNILYYNKNPKKNLKKKKNFYFIDPTTNKKHKKQFFNKITKKWEYTELWEKIKPTKKIKTIS